MRKEVDNPQFTVEPTKKKPLINIYAESTERAEGAEKNVRDGARGAGRFVEAVR
jgi:hypothetical protein